MSHPNKKKANQTITHEKMEKNHEKMEEILKKIMKRH